MLKKLMLLLMVTLLTVGTFTGCELVEDDDVTNNNLEIAGNWVDNYSTNNTITDVNWITDGQFGFTTTILEHNNNENYLFSNNKYGYGKTVWTEIEDENGSNVFYQCGIVNSKTSLQEAKDDTTTADATDPANSGCGSFSWTKMTAQ